MAHRLVGHRLNTVKGTKDHDQHRRATARRMKDFGTPCIKNQFATRRIINAPTALRPELTAVATPELFKNRFNIQVCTDSEVTSINRTDKNIVVHDRLSGKVISQADPQKKLQIIRDLQHQGYQVAMIGDGINDAPALAAANLSLAIDKGTDIAIESSDLILLHGDIAKVYDAITLSSETLTNIKQNLFWAFAYNTVAIPFAVAGRLSPTVASAAMALSSVSVIANSLRINKT